MSLILTEKKQVQNSNQYWAFATLNSEATLNSLSLEMIQELVPLLKAWRADSNCVGVFLQGAGEKAFCAGGDIKRLYQALKARKENPNSTDSYAEDFFSNEYSLDYSIHQFPKPVIVFGHGIVMGGGLGLMNGATVRIATESTKIAMPEISIGLFPDVGASYFLHQVPGSLGLFLGLTGARLSSKDCLFAKLVDFQIERSKKEQLIDGILKLKYHSNKEADLKTIRDFCKSISWNDTSNSKLAEHQSFIDSLIHNKNLSNTLKNLLSLVENKDEWLAASGKFLARGCPTSAHLIFEQLQRSKNLNLVECFNMELNMAYNVGRFDNFREGVRALLIDKDNKPAWNPPSFETVTKDSIEQHFVPSGHKIKEIWE